MKKLFSIFLSKSKSKKVDINHISDIQPRGISKTTVSKEYLEKFPNWDKEKFNNIEIVD